MPLERKWTLTGFLILALLVMLTTACSEGPDAPAPRPDLASTGSFTFFNIGKETTLDSGKRDNLENILGDDAIERRGILNLELNHKTFLQDHFPELDRMNRQLNSDIGLRVKHRIIRLMYRYARQKGLPYDLVEIIYAEDTRMPLAIRLHFKTGAVDTLRALEEKYGSPRSFSWGRENASSEVWEKEGDYLFYSVLPKRGDKVEYRVAIYFTAEISKLIQSEQREREAGSTGKTGF